MHTVTNRVSLASRLLLTLVVHDMYMYSSIRISARTSDQSTPRVDDGGLLINPYKHQKCSLSSGLPSPPLTRSATSGMPASGWERVTKQLCHFCGRSRLSYGYLTPESDRTKTPCEIVTIRWLGQCAFDVFGMLVQWFWRPRMVKNLYTLPGPDKPVDLEIFFSVWTSPYSTRLV